MDSVRSTSDPKKRTNTTVGLLARSCNPWSILALIICGDGGCGSDCPGVDLCISY